MWQVLGIAASDLDLHVDLTQGQIIIRRRQAFALLFHSALVSVIFIMHVGHTFLVASILAHHTCLMHCFLLLLTVESLRDGVKEEVADDEGNTSCTCDIQLGTTVYLTLGLYSQSFIGAVL